MSNDPLIKIKSDTAAEICANFDLAKDARSLLTEGMRPDKFLEALAAKKQYVPGIEFLAHALPPREAIWWGCLCLQHACGDGLSPAEKAACKATVRWILQPNEENRAAAKTPAEEAGAASPAGHLAKATYHTGGNVAPPKAPPKAPGPYASAQSVSTAVKLAGAKADPAKIIETQRLFVELGVRIGEGRFDPAEAKNRTAVSS